MITKVITTKDSQGRYKTFKKQFSNERHVDNYCRVVENNGTKVIGVEEPKVSDIDKWKGDIEPLLSRVEDVINRLPDNPNNGEYCKKVFLTRALQELWSTVNGTTYEDLIDKS